MKLQDVELQLAAAVEATQKFFDMVDGLSPGEALPHYYRFKTVYDALKARLTTLEKLKGSLQYGALPKIMTRHNCRNLTDDALGIRFALARTTRVKMLDKDAGKGWLRDNGMGDLIIETVNAQTLGAAIGDYIETKRCDPPEEIFEVTPVIGVTATKAKTKAF